MAKGKFVTAINCMDGRTQLPVNEYLRKKYNADYVDTITEPGPIKFLAEQHDASIVKSIRNRIDISLEKHGSQVVAIVGHYDCGGNPVDEQAQRKQIAKSIELVHSWHSDISIIGLWVNEQWDVSET